MDLSFYQQFSVIIAGLDNVEARRWINKTVIEMVQRDKNGQVINDTRHYLIDGGTEGFNG
jgi:ubiquitin-activating enzyme E1 C